IGLAGVHRPGPNAVGRAMNSKLESLVQYLAGQAHADTDRLRDELDQPDSEASLALLAVRRRTRRMLAGPSYRWLGVSAQRGVSDVAPPLRPRSWRCLLLLAFPWLLALGSLTVAAIPVFDRIDEPPPVLPSAPAS